MKPKELVSVLAVLLLACVLRTWGAWYPFVDDAPDWIRIATDVSIRPFYMPLSGSYHGPLTVYLLKLSSFLFGRNMIGWRALHIASSLTHLVLIYFFVKSARNSIEAWVTLFLTSCNVFMIWQVFDGTQEEFLLLAGTAVLFTYWKAIEGRKPGYLIYTGVLMGLGVLIKEVILLLALPLLIFLAVDTQTRQWFRRKELYIAILAGIIIASPYLWWDWHHEWFHLRRIIFKEDMAFRTFSLFHGNPTILYLFVGPLLLKIPGYNQLVFWFPQSAVLVRSGIFSVTTDYGIQCMNPFMGLLSIGALLFSLKSRDRFIRLVSLVMLSVVGVSLSIFREQPRIYSIIIVPSLILAAYWAGSVHRRYKKNLAVSAAGLSLCVFFMSDALFYTSHIGTLIETTSMISIPVAGVSQSVNLNLLGRRFSAYARRFGPTLLVFPDPAMDSLSNYVTAYSGVKAIDRLEVNRYLDYTARDFRKILVFFTPESRQQRLLYESWARDNGYEITEREDPIVLRDEPLLIMNVHSMALSQLNTKRAPDIAGFLELQYD